MDGCFLGETHAEISRSQEIISILFVETSQYAEKQLSAGHFQKAMFLFGHRYIPLKFSDISH